MASVVLVATAHLDAAPLGTTVNYQGRLTASGTGANGQFDMRFRLYNDPSAGSQVGPTATVAPVHAMDGLFTARLDFGAGVFNGTAYWLEIGVRPNGSASPYTVLTPRQALNAVAHSVWAINAGTASTASGVAVNAVSGSGIQDNTITATKVAGGELVKSLNGLFDNVTLTAGAGITLTPSAGNTLTVASTAGPGWSLAGNPGTTPGMNFVGTTDNQPLDLYANYTRGLRLQYNSQSSGGGALLFNTWGMNVLGGLDVNFIRGDVVGATIAGGGAGSGTIFLPSYSSNTVTANLGTIGGGAGNTVSGTYGTVPGGHDNLAQGVGSFAAGRRARSFHDGSFVWGDGTQDANTTGPNRFEVLATGGATFYTGGSHVRCDSPFAIVTGGGGEQAYLGGDGVGADVQIGSLNPAVQNIAAYNPSTGYMNVIVKTLTITGGADLAEPFEVSEPTVPKGSVVVIDEQNPGQLRLSTQSYDRRVAGVVSGANGVQPGIHMKQSGRLEGTQDIALSGRVYVWADATAGAIQPGNLLTTSNTPGHAMKALDHTRAQGAILGKAMTDLAEGRGLVLVLVTLQ